MRGKTCLVLWLAVWDCAALTHVVRGDDHCHGPSGTPPPGKPRRFEHTQQRAGNPLWLSAHAAPTITPDYVGYYVGGGSAHVGEPRRWEEGTWGWDYEGWHILRRVPLLWSHGAREQGGTGAYRTDARHIRDIFSVRPFLREETR